MEEWRAVVGYEGLYEVSNLGRIRRACSCNNSKKGRILKTDNVKGYLRASIYKNGVKNRFFVHRIVAIAFITKDEHRNFVNHLNGIKTDNRINNLEWVTQSENAQHAIATGLTTNLCGEDHPAAKLTNDDIRKIREIYKTGIPQHKIAKMFGIVQSGISQIVNFNEWSHVNT